MGYNTADGATGKGLGQFTAAAQGVSDLNKTIELIGRMGNRRAGTAAERAALTGSALYAGLEFHETDTGLTYLRAASSWVLTDGDTGWTLCTSQNVSIYTVSTYGDDRALSVRRIGKHVVLEGHIVSNVGTSPDAIWAYIPVGFRPEKNRRVLIQLEGNGTTTVRGFVTPAGALTVSTGIATGTRLLIADSWFIE